ncbi:autotransporter outer membrane beta-barrel domain-containing protein [Helicobacter anatolicus]|uniref:autotransporter outer membrane beta-barrel domain-containing protein n=1 Tax=Helicobacter anatolicus TaxID=2905874 RepID=UPI001E62DD77|nr:autotransporter outer membrane beta-barrel domain-containing protein [Helicobacter anatolicus]MCE3038561.1 autotransporter outer membrane beta-barrel domain-containing protein [Helicobacter anatolicus]
MQNYAKKYFFLKNPRGGGNKIFKPAVATSLALLLNLGGNMAYAQASTESNCIDSNNCQQISQDITLFFATSGSTNVNIESGKVTFGQNVNTVNLSDKNFENTTPGDGVFNFPNSTLTIDFGQATSKTFNLTAENAIFKGNILLAGAKTGNTFTGSFTKGYEGTIEFRGDSTHNITLAKKEMVKKELEEMSQPEDSAGLSIKGDIIMGQNVSSGSMTIDLADANNKIIGNIYRYKTSNESSGSDTAKIVIKNGILEGNIGGQHLNTNSGAKNFNVELVDGATMKGNIQTGLPTSGNDFVGNYVIFGGTSPVMEEEAAAKVVMENNDATKVYLDGNIISYGTGFSGKTDTKKGNHVTFEKGIMQGKILAGKAVSDGTRYGYNNIVFKQAGIKLDKLSIESTGGTNEIVFKNGQVDSEASSMSKVVAKAAEAKTITAATFIGNITADSGGKNIITFEKDGALGAATMSQNTADQITKITANNQSTNLITFKEGGKVINTAFETFNGGTNTVTFETKDNTTSPILMLGDINTQSGSNNFTFKITDATASEGVASAAGATDLLKNAVFAGNILTNGGATRIIFDNSFWIPNNAAELLASKYDDSLATQHQELMQYLTAHPNGSGNIITKNGGGTTIVLREKTSNFTTDKAANFKITNAGSSTTNVVIQAPVKVSADIDYAGRFDNDDNYIWDGSSNSGIVNIVFANNNNLGDSINGQNGTTNGSVQDDFSTGTDNNFNENKFLGVTYKDGLRFNLRDRNITLQDEYGTYSASFTGAFKDYLGTDTDRKGLLKITVDKTPNMATRQDGQTTSYKDKITLDGIAVGSIVALESSNSSANSNYIIELTKGSIFFGDFDYSKIKATSTDQANPVKVDMIMKEGSKLLVPGGTNIINLTFDNAPVVDPTDPNLLLNTIAQKNTIVDIGSYGNDASFIPTRTSFNLLQIGDAPQNSSNTTEMLGKSGLKGDNAIFRVYVNTDAFQGRKNAGSSGATLNGESSKAGTGQYGHVYSDRVIVYDIQNGETGSASTPTKAVTEYIQILTNGNVSKIKYAGGGTETAGNIAVMTVKQGSQDVNSEGVTEAEKKSLVNLKSTNAVVGFDVFSSELIGVTTDRYGKTTNNNGGYTTYFIKDAKAETSTANKVVSSSALNANYELYLANLNSLNKRMGELRDNSNAHGVWARVFTGMQTSSFATQSTSYYTTIQGGYDYAFGMEGANNYLGFAISYANSVNKTDLLTEEVTNHKKGINSSIANGAEIAIYNAYVQDGASKANGFKNGLYSDTILKLSFINNRLSFFNESGNDSVNNFAFTFSQELGYRFLLGEKNEWYIDPQAEIAFGFLDQSSLRRVLGAYHLDGVQDAILTLRGRIGSSFGYKFDRFTQDKGFRSQLYIGTYYTGDYIHGGSINLTSSAGGDSTLTPLASTGRFTLNLGTNFTIKDHHRIYFDFERSFGGKIVTQYQFNLGYRYSFGENKKYTPTALTITSDIKKDKKQTENKEEATKN